MFTYKKRQRYPYNRRWRPIGLWDVKAPTFSKQSAHKWRWGCQPYAPACQPAALYPQEDRWYSFLLEAESTPKAIVRLEGLGQFKNPMTSSVIETVTFRLAAQCLNQLRYRVPPSDVQRTKISAHSGAKWMVYWAAFLQEKEKYFTTG
jgi:hypothetical protein